MAEKGDRLSWPGFDGHLERGQDTVPGYENVSVTFPAAHRSGILPLLLRKVMQEEAEILRQAQDYRLEGRRRIRRDTVLLHFLAITGDTHAGRTHTLLL